MSHKSVLEVLDERGFTAQCTNLEGLKKILDEGPCTFYIGFDPTADSLHVGHFVTMMAMRHLQNAGHVPICLMGGGTGMIGDPSGRTDLRKVLTPETIRHNVENFKKQMGLILDISEGKAVIADNADWLLDLNYVDFLREIGAHFSVNRMLTAEAYKQRMERGLTFLEFNYMLMQAFDFLQLYRKYKCRIQFGGDDQWSNILAGIDLIRRKEGIEAYGLTFKLLTTSQGIKMGKTSKGALWLDPEKCPPFDFYQYWRNIDDADLENCMKLLTFMPLAEIAEYTRLKDKEINTAKKKLAYEVTATVHGEEAAKSAQNQAEALFEGGGSSSDMPEISFDSKKLGQAKIVDFLLSEGIIPSKGEGRRLITQGGLYINNIQVKDTDKMLSEGDFEKGFAMIRKGKKKHYKLRLK